MTDLPPERGGSSSRALLLELVWFYLLFEAAFWLGDGLSGLGESDQLQAWPLLLSQLLMVALVVPAVALLLQRAGSSLHELGFRRPPGGWGRALIDGVRLGVAIKVATIPVGILIALCGVRPEPVEFRHDGLAATVVMVLGGALAAVVEEVVFRGYLRQRIGALFGWGGGVWPTGVVVSVLFGLGHGYQGLLGIFVTTLTGLLLFAVVCSRRWNLTHAIVAHATFNAIAILLASL